MSFWSDFQYFLEKFIVLLIGQNHEGVTTKIVNVDNTDKRVEFNESTRVFTFTFPNQDKGIELKYDNAVALDKNLLGLIANICTTFAGGSQYKYNGTSRFEFSSIDKYRHYSYLVRLGFCTWISNLNTQAIDDV